MPMYPLLYRLDALQLPLLQASHHFRSVHAVCATSDKYNAQYVDDMTDDSIDDEVGRLQFIYIRCVFLR